MKHLPRGWLSARWSWLALAALLVIGAVGGFAGYDRYAEGQRQAHYPPIGSFVEVAGGRMHYLCAGSGEPTIVLTAGIGGGALDWSQVMPPLSEHHRVCAFDRLGQDWSDAAPHPRTFSTAADELHSALETLGIEAPVLVGHSLGGALAQLYAARHPVAGVVLVDGLTSDVAAPVVARLGSYQSLDGAARLGLLRPLGELFAYPAYPSDVRDQMRALRSGSSAILRIAEEGALARAAGDAALRDAEAQLTMPLLVIVAGRSDVPGLSPGAFQAAAAAFAGRHPQAQLVVIPGAPHYVHATHPAEVASTIARWLDGLTDGDGAD